MTQEGLDLYLSAVERLDKSNPQVASRLMTGLARWYTLEPVARQIAKQKIEDLQSKVGSKNVLEFVHNLLKDK